eukprot:TRINITY_DN6609_c0_g2_i3.p3 TRINITY_DN6609_c0_g2~~TRINITY_DN6609_c0_g2_i3.p3  ORF type:complete len:129 (-),score=28.71 TRINITY_DN6609_c0_g2_i3:35-421(-)
MNDVNIQLLFPFSISVPDFTGDSSTSSEDLCKYLFKIEDLYQYGDTPACTINNEVIQINFDDYYNIEYDESIEPISGVIKRTGCNDYLKSVSYTHLTLPTICSVQISVVAVSLKKKKKQHQRVMCITR